MDKRPRDIKLAAGFTATALAWIATPVEIAMSIYSGRPLLHMLIVMQLLGVASVGTVCLAVTRLDRHAAEARRVTERLLPIVYVALATSDAPLATEDIDTDVTIAAQPLLQRLIAAPAVWLSAGYIAAAAEALCLGMLALVYMHHSLGDRMHVAEIFLSLNCVAAVQLVVRINGSRAHAAGTAWDRIAQLIDELQPAIGQRVKAGGRLRLVDNDEGPDIGGQHKATS